jgi:hypothetical protein
MAVRRSVFAALGGFDEGYRNGFEDVDFCLRVRERGGRVVYQPASTLYHLESQTAGRKANDEANGRRLLERWGAHWARVGDEDTVLVASGWAACTEEGTGGKILKLLTDPAERERWQRVAAVQHALRANDLTGIRRIFATTRDWPDDPSLRSWLDRVAKLAGVPTERAASAAHA